MVYSLSGVIIVASAFILFNIGSLFGFINGLIDVLSPFIWGVFFAFIMSKFANFLEKKLSKKMSFKTKRFVSSLLSVLLLVLIVTLIGLLPLVAVTLDVLVHVIFCNLKFNVPFNPAR